MNINNNFIYIIAELGINHHGSINQCKKIIKSISNSNIHAIKFQYRNLNRIYTNALNEISDNMLYKEIKRNYLSPSQINELIDYAHNNHFEVGISFFDVKDINDFGTNIKKFDFFKIPSPELLNLNLIKTLSFFEKKIFISTGAHEQNDIDFIFKNIHLNNVIPMHCVSNYPLELFNSKLGYIKYLKNKFKTEVGYSSHDKDWENCLFAITSGAKYIERHITLDKEKKGLDQSTSSTPDEFKKLARFAENYLRIIQGNSSRRINQGEKINIQNLGRSLYAVKDIKINSKFMIKDFKYRSPNIGLNNTNIKAYLGKKIIKSLKKNDPITVDCFSKKNIKFSRDELFILNKFNISVPVRLHDIEKIQDQIPIKNYEFHLSYSEILGKINFKGISPSKNYSVHLPDYISENDIFDPFSTTSSIRKKSLLIMKKTIDFSLKLKEFTNSDVLIVGSFSKLNSTKLKFYSNISSLIKNIYEEHKLEILPQWLPPFAWYFGGSVNIDVFNNINDIPLIKKNKINLCLDVSHFLLGSNFYEYSPYYNYNLLMDSVRHIHISDASGFDGEGLSIGDGDINNLKFLKKILKTDTVKVIENWQGHLNNFYGFKLELKKIVRLLQNEKN